MKITTNPQDPEFGSSVDLDSMEETDVVIETETEGIPWLPVDAPSCARPVCAFIDGTRRVDHRFYVTGDDGRQGEAIAGCWGVGAAWSSSPPCFDNIEVGRSFIVGGGVGTHTISLAVTGASLVYHGSQVPENDTEHLIGALQRQMRVAEGNLAERLDRKTTVEMIVVDGPLGYDTKNPVVGLIKRQGKRYLSHEHSQILKDLRVGQRTPMFLMRSGSKMVRYSWYTRIAQGRRIDSYMTGLVRNEISGDAALESAIHYAGLTARALPDFASRYGSDPRAPQNLYPVGQLERQLKRMLGDRQLIRRHLDAYVDKKLRNDDTP